jgi:hypothetical protein
VDLPRLPRLLRCEMLVASLPSASPGGWLQVGRSDRADASYSVRSTIVSCELVVVGDLEVFSVGSVLLSFFFVCSSTSFEFETAVLIFSSV